MANVSLTVEDLVNKALEEGPKFAAMQISKQATVLKQSSAIDLADSLDKLASEIEHEASLKLSDFKNQQSEKRANMTDIIKTYVELETSR